ncbi:Xenotropic and polytropic retrovirus receptor 1 [Apophysomyces ossiformis]|uniref:Xenotropic and polytropic retrovirus receptor 1 n=1 Tax=Apophysomyces ossiformis TaxID=679940 RepID=A0A8H7BWB0_9FUNG|nr:Xenotropic and polytropic retrovirus receptor 1 [Apophysomyces ossiformis]
MKFAKYLESESIPEWRKAYINYKGLKKRLKTVEKFRKYNERRAAVDLDNALYDIEDERRPHFPRNAFNLSRQSSFANLMRKLSVRFNRDETELHKVTSRPVPKAESLHSTATLSVLDEVLLHASDSERMFFNMLNGESEKISRFYDEKEKDARTKLETLKMQMQLVAEHGRHLAELGVNDLLLETQQRYNPLQWIPFRKSSPTETPHLPLSDVGHHHISFNTAGWKASGLYAKRLKVYHWVTSEELDDIIKETEALYINEFADGHRRRGMRKLRVPEKQEDYNATSWRVGLYLGIALALLLNTLIPLFGSDQISQRPNLWFNLQIYGCIILPILFCLGFTVNLLVWHRSRISYKFIFELDPRQNLDYHQFAELPAFMLLITAYIMHIDIDQSYTSVPSELCPLILWVVLSAIVLCPFNIFYLSARKWLGISLLRIVLSYCFSVEFRDFFIADELNSLAYSFWTMSYFFCAYTWQWTQLTSHCQMEKTWLAPFLASLPPWWRLLQCIRRYKDSREQVHLLNAAKYLTSIAAAVITGIRRIYPSSTMDTVYILTCVISSSYTATWDIKMDWGLLQPYSRHFLLRDELVFYHWTYYVAIPINLILRFAWLLNLKFTFAWMGFFTALLEAFRRIQWNFFRLENEHINNCGQYRAIKEIPLPFVISDMKEPDQERGVQLPVAEPDPIMISRQPSVAQDSFHGSFYGRRDFENKHDKDANREIPGSQRQPSAMETVLTRIRSMSGDLGDGASDTEHEDASDTEPDDDEESL